MTLGSNDALLLVSTFVLGVMVGLIVLEETVGRRRTNGLVRLANRLADDPASVRGRIRMHDRRLQRAFESLAARLSAVQAMATTDPLTGLLNRQTILSLLESEIDRASRYQRSLSIIFIDVDHFKRVNDSFGHHAGDRMLSHVAALLRSNVRSVDHVGRYGGEEFVLVMPETDVDAAATSAEKLRRIVGSSELELEDGNVLQVTISAGVAGGIGSHLQLDPLIRDADAALFAAKGLGRDQVYVFRAVNDDAMIPRAPISPEARRRALEVGQAAFGAASAHLTHVLETREPWAGAPSQLIAEVAVSLAWALGLPDGEVERIRTAALLHDLGKLAVPEEILHKPHELTQSEWSVVTEHPKIGQVILEQAGALRDAATVVLHHHEWYNGRGYPHGLAGGEIPIGARIVAIADAYDAMVRGRPYQDPLAHREALLELQAHAGTQFDPELISLFIRLYGSEAFASRFLPGETDATGAGQAAARPATMGGGEELDGAPAAAARRSRRRTSPRAASASAGDMVGEVDRRATGA